MSTRIPPNLLYLTVFNPTLVPTDTAAADDDEDAEEQAHIVFYTSKERAVSRDRMLRQIGLAKALINFSEIFTPEDQCNNIHSQSRRMIMVSPEPDFWIHACVELARSTRPPTIGRSKGKAKSATIGRSSKGKELALVTDYDEASVDDIALREDITRGYEDFKLKCGSMTHILATLGQQALELQLERFFTPWAWSWEIEEANIYGRHLGAPMHPKHRPIIHLLDSTCPQIPALVVTPLHVIPSTAFIEARYPTSVSRLLSALLPPPAAPSPAEDSPSEKPPDAVGKETNTNTFLGMPTTMPSMNMGLKLNWPGYLTFKGKRTAEPAPTPSPDHISDPADVERRPEEAVVDKQALDDAMNSENPASDSKSLSVADTDSLLPPPSPKPASIDSSAPPSPAPVTELSTISIHLAPPDNPLQTARTSVSFLSRYPILIAFIGSSPTAAAVQRLSHEALNILDEQALRSSSTETLPTAVKILQPKDRHIIVQGHFVHSNETFESKGEQLYVAQRLFESDPDIREVFSRGVNPPHWHVAKRGWAEEREGEGHIYMEVLRKETTLSDVDNVAIGQIRKFVASNAEAETLTPLVETV